MSRISAWILALMLACMPLALAESESLIPQEMIKADKVNYKTATAETGLFERTVSAAATEYYPYTYSLSFDKSGARFVGYDVIRGNEVKKGDVLARFTLEADSVALESLKMQLADARKALEKRIADEGEAALERSHALLCAENPQDREMLILQSRRAELTLEQYEFNQNRTIAQLEAEIAEIELRRQESVIVAPVDGVIIGTEYKREGDRIYPGQQLITMYRTDGMLMRIDNSNGYFRYGMDVTLELGSNKSRTQLPGRVVGADALVPAGKRTGDAYIEVEIPESLKLTRPVVSGATLSVQDVLLAPRKAIMLDGGKHCVTVLADGVPVRRYINCMVHNTVPSVWVLQGLEPGDEIIID